MDENIAKLLFLVLSIFTKSAFACNGYELVINYARNCGQNDVIKVENPDTTMSSDCLVTFRGYGVLPIRLEKILLNYKVTLSPVLNGVEGDVDICERAKRFEKRHIDLLNKYELPTSCPVEPFTYVGGDSKSVNITKYKDKLKMLRNPFVLKLNFDHGEAGKTCFETSFQMKRANGRGGGGGLLGRAFGG